MKTDRGMIKWQPFNSVISSQKIITDILKEKNKITRPVLSNENIKEIEDKLIDSYYCQTTINIHYYTAGIIKTIKAKIKKIDYVSKIIYLNNLKIYFKQILSID